MTCSIPTPRDDEDPQAFYAAGSAGPAKLTTIRPLCDVPRLPARRREEKSDDLAPTVRLG